MKLLYCEFFNMLLGSFRLVSPADRGNSRFLSARRFDAQKAYSHFQKAYQVRNTNKLCEFYENIDVEVYQQTTTLVCHSLSGSVEYI